MPAAPQPDRGQRRTRAGKSSPATRLLFPTDRADLRVSWHGDEDQFVLSLWHGDACVGTASLAARDAAEVASFLVTQLGERGSWTPRVVGPEAPASAPSRRSLARRVTDRLRRRS